MRHGSEDDLEQTKRTGQLSLISGEEAPIAAPNQKRTLLALSLVRGVGEATLTALARRLPDLGAVWNMRPEGLRETLAGTRVRVPPTAIREILDDPERLLAEADRELERLGGSGIRLLTQRDAEYPMRLAAVPDAPVWLWVQGDPALLDHPAAVAVVGTRDASVGGLSLARELTGWLAARGALIVSGLAEGIDAAAHETALDYGAPTVAVLGTGISVVFPASTAHIRRRIVEGGGALVSEYFPQTSYSRARFVQRNRIQAGLACAVAIVEAREQSGTAHTYRFAKSYDRLVFGVRRGSNGPTSEVRALLRREGQPVVDLGDSASLARLANALNLPVEAPQQPPSHRWDTVLGEFERVLSLYPMTGAELSDLTTTLSLRWRRANRAARGED